MNHLAGRVFPAALGDLSRTGGGDQATVDTSDGVEGHVFEDHPPAPRQPAARG